MGDENVAKVELAKSKMQDTSSIKSFLVLHRKPADESTLQPTVSCRAYICCLQGKHKDSGPAPEYRSCRIKAWREHLPGVYFCSGSSVVGLVVITQIALKVGASSGVSFVNFVFPYCSVVIPPDTL